MQNPPPPPGGYQPARPPGPAMTPYQGYAPRQQTYAGFWIRLVARFVDGVILSVPLSIILIVLVAVGGGLASTTTNSDQNTQNTAAVAVSGLFILFYLAAL